MDMDARPFNQQENLLIKGSGNHEQRSIVLFEMLKYRQKLYLGISAFTLKFKFERFWSADDQVGGPTA